MLPSEIRPVTPVVGRADDEQAGAAVLGAVVEDVGSGRPGDGERLERNAVERGLDGGQAGERGAAELLLVGATAAEAERDLTGIDGDGDDRRTGGAGEQRCEHRRLGIVAQRVHADDDGRCHDDLPGCG